MSPGYYTFGAPKDRRDNDAAIAYFRRVLDIKPADKIAKNQLERLKGGPIHSTPQRAEWAAIQSTMDSFLENVSLGPPVPCDPIDVHWPTNDEHFAEGWNVEAVVGEKTLPLRHFLGHRVAYGRLRRRSITYVRNNVEVEGDAADDYPRTQGL